MYLFLLFSLYMLIANNQCNGEFIRTQGTDFYYGNRKVFLSGANIAWVYYGWDFGNDNYAATRERLEQWIRDISNAGGNTLRMFVHVEAGSTPQFDPTGHVVATDAGNNLVRDISLFLDVAEQYNVFVVLVLWNGAGVGNTNYRNLFMVDSILTSYINNALVPLVQGISNKPALAAYEIINEPEHALLIAANAQPCFDTTLIGLHGGGGNGADIPMQRLQQFINRQADAIKRTDHKALVTVGSWREVASTDAFADTFNYYSQHCLEIAGGYPLGALDFYQIHAFAWGGWFSAHSPFTLPASAFQKDKPLVIGAFSFVCADGLSVPFLWNHAFDQGYDGVWSWKYNLDDVYCSDTQASQNLGMTTIRHHPEIIVNISN